MTLAEYSEHWLYVTKRTEVKVTTFSTLVAIFNRYIKNELGRKELNEITDEDVQISINGIYDKGLSTSTAKKVYNFLTNIFTYAYYRGDVDRNPMILVKSPSYNLKPAEEIQTFSEEELYVILQIVNQRYSNGKLIYRYGYAFILMVNTGLRPCELLGLKWSDIKGRSLTVRRSVVSNQNPTTHKYETIIQNTLKTNKSKRTLYLNDIALAALSNLKLSQKIESEYIVSCQDGGFLPPQQLRKTWYKILKAGNLPKKNLYTLRHTFATVLFQKNVPLKNISEMLGHSSIRITADTYVHLCSEVDTSPEKLEPIFISA